MQVKALIVCAAVAAALNVNLSAAEQPGAPHGWTASPSVGTQYEVGFDAQEDAVYLKALSESADAMGALHQAIKAPPLAGRVLTLTSEVKVDQLSRDAQTFIQCKDRNNTHGASGNIKHSGEPLEGSWWKVKVAMALEETSAALESCHFGITLKGKGHLWIRRMHLDIAAIKQGEKQFQPPPYQALIMPPPNAAPVNTELRP